MKNRIGVWLLALVCSGGVVAQTPPAAALGEEPVGRVKTLRGKVTIRTQSQTVEAAVGTPVYLGSEIQTTKDASVGLTFKDSTVLSLGADTKLTVDAYVYDPNQGQYKFGANLGKGALNYISGAIAKARPEGVSVKTQGAVIGVRGTNLVIKAEDTE